MKSSPALHDETNRAIRQEKTFIHKFQGEVLKIYMDVEGLWGEPYPMPGSNPPQPHLRGMAASSHRHRVPATHELAWTMLQSYLVVSVTGCTWNKW
jgi:hypothetical protein